MTVLFSLMSLTAWSRTVGVTLLTLNVCWAGGLLNAVSSSVTVTLIATGSWSTQLYAENFTDTRAILSASYAEFVKMNTINRPRTLGLRFSYKFGGG